MAGGARKGAPGFTAAFVIAGTLAIAYAMMRRRNGTVEFSSDRMKHFFQNLFNR